MPAPLTPYEVEQQLTRELAQVTDGHERVILAAWALAWSEISGDLFDTLLDLLSGGTRVTAATVVRSERLASTLAMIADAIDDLAQAAGVTVTADLDAVLTQATAGTVRLIEPQVTGRSDLVFDPRRPTPPETLAVIVRRTTEQITSELLPVADETYATIQRELVRGVAVGENPRETARRMVDRSEDLWNFGRSRAVTIARTEVLDAYREGARVTRQAHADVLAGWVWLAHLGPRTCRSCLSMHGRLFGLDEPGPEDHQQGRCTGCPVVRGEDGEPDLSWLPDAEAHLRSLTRSDQVAILGKKGHAAWVAGDFPIEAWTRTRHTDGWRDSQVPAAPGDADAGSGRSGPPPDQAPPSPAGDDEPEFNFKGETVSPREVDFVRRFLASGERIEWIPTGSNGREANGEIRSTNDFVWLSNGSIEIELKSPGVMKYENARRLIMDSVKAARRHRVVKNNFVVDLGDETPSAELLEQLRRYNVDRSKYQIARLWAFWSTTLLELDLDT